MFTEFGSIRGSIWKQEVSSIIGIVFLSTCALWAAMFMINLTDGTNPVSEGIASAIAHEDILP